ncbi:hypothetical protein BGZ95_011317 [Linnemannia exigua]|uniref:Uncharacterized protein n=1 Tax=Linnemannia exigua TaxID=604196 RepID=A0AAD4DLE5_9FUNG|nr:hypothetical protein BGZ95_011317 [Linnemannia exigua]
MAAIVRVVMAASIVMPTITAQATNYSPGAIILGGLGALIPKPASAITATSYITPGMANLTSIGVFVNASTLISFQATGSLKNPISELPLPLGQAGFSISVDGQNIANITAYNLTLPGGTGPININATIALPSVSPTPAIQTSLNNLVVNLLGMTTPSGPPPILVISDFTLSGTNVGLAPITVPVQPSSAPTQAPGAILPPPVIGMWGLLNSNITFAAPTLKKLAVKTVSGAKLTVGANFEWNNPLNVALDIPFISADLGFNGTRIATLIIHALQLAPGPMSADTTIDIVFNNDREASTQLAAFVNGFLAGQLSQIINLGNLSFGTTDDNSATNTILNTLFSGIYVDIPMLGYNTIVLQQLVLSVFEPLLPFPIDLGKLSGSGASLLQYIKTLGISTAPGSTLLLKPMIELPLPFQLDLNIPYLGLDVTLNDNLLGQLFLVDVVGTGKGQISVSGGIGLTFREPNPSVPAAIVQLLEGLSIGASTGINAGLANLAIGVSPSDAITTLNALGVNGPLSSIVTGSLGGGSQFQTKITVVQNTININIGSLVELAIHGASVSVLPNNIVTAAVKLEVFLGLPVVVNIGYLGIQVQLDGAQLAGLRMDSGVSLNRGRVQMDAGIALNVSTGPTIGGKVAALVNAIIAKQAVTSTVAISGIVIGASSNDIISAFSSLSFQLPLGGLFGGGASPSDGFLNNTISQLGFKVSDLSLATIPNAGLHIGAKATFSNPIPISISVPYIGVIGGLDSVDLATVGINDLAFVPGANSLQAGIDLTFNNANNAQNKIGGFLGKLINGQLGSTPETLSFRDFRIGASPLDYFDLLSQIKLAFPSKDIFTKVNLDAAAAWLGLDLSKATSNLLGSLKIGTISLGLDTAPIIDLSTSLAVSNFSLNAAVDIGYIGVDLALDSHSFAHVDIPSINITTANNQLIFVFKAAIAVEDTPAVQTAIANIVNYLSTNTTSTLVNNLIISRPLLGVSTTDNIKTFVSIEYHLALSDLLVEARIAVTKLFSGANGLSLNNMALSGLILDLNSPSIVSVQGALLVKNFTLPADISISYIGASLALDVTPLADLTIPSLALTSANNHMAIDFKARLNLQQGQDVSSQVAKLFEALVNPGKASPPTNLLIYNPVFGGDPQHLYHILSQVKFNIVLAPYLQQFGAVINGGDSGSFLNGFDLGALKVDLNNPQVIGVDATIAIKNITIPAEIKLNYVGVNLAVNTIGLAQVSVPQVTLKPANGALSISAHLDIALLTSKEMTSAINNLLGGVLNNKTVPATNLVLSSLVFGGSSTDVFTILQGLNILIDVSPYIAKFGTLLGGSGSFLSGLGLSGLVIDLNQTPSLSIDANIAIKNLALPAELNVGYIGLNIAANNVPLAKVGIPKIQFRTIDTALTITTHLDVALQETGASQTLAAGLVNALAAGQTPQGTLVLSGLTFGPTESNVYTILQGVQIPIPVSSIFSAAPATASSGIVPSSLLDKLSLQSAEINMKSPPSIGADIAIAFGYKVDAKLLLNYIGFRAFLDTTPLATVTVPDIALASGNTQVALKAKALIKLSSGADIQAKVAAVAAQAMSNGGAQNVNLVISNIAFGGSADNVFHILDKVKVSVPIGPYIQQLTSFGGGIFDSAGNNSLSLSQLDVSAPSANELSVTVGAALGGLGSKISVEMPYIGLQVSTNGNGFVYPTINNLQLANGKVALTLGLPFQSAARNIFASLSTPISQLLFSSVSGSVPGSFTINSIEFGASAGQSFDLASKIGLNFGVNSIFQALQSYKNGQRNFQLSDANSVFTASGVQASIAISGAPLGLPIKLNFPISLTGNYKNNTFATAQVTSLNLNHSPWIMDTAIRPADLAAQPAISSMIANGLQGKDVVQDITLRDLTLGPFTVFTSLAISLPEIVLDSSASATDVKTHLSPLGADFSVTYDNKGPLRVDMGSITILIKQGSSADVMQIHNTAGPIHLNSANQNGGNNAIPMYAEMKFSFLEFFVILASLMNPGDKFQFQFWVTAAGGGAEAVRWLEDGLNGVPDSVYGSFLPAMAKNLVF